MSIWSGAVLAPPLAHWHVVAAGGAGVELARAADLLRRVLDHLLPLGDPADGPGDREKHGEHRSREAERPQDDSRIKIDIGIELALYEIFIVERRPLEL